VSHLPSKLNSYWLWREVSSKLGLSNPTYRYWKNTPNLKLNNKYLFIQKKTLPQKYEQEFEYKFVEDVKFVNIKKFFMEFGIKVSKNSIIQLAKIKDLDIGPDCTFYNLKNDYGIVVYD